MEEFNFDAFESYAKIVVVGVGGAGNNAVNQMIEDNITNITFWVINTDAQALATSQAEHKAVIGKDTTKGLGAGGNPEIGRAAAESSIDDIREIVQGANMVFIAAGMGGGTGTGAAPVVARIAKEAGALTIAIVTRPFSFEGNSRKAKAVEGLNALKNEVDSIIVVSNDKLMMMNGNKSIAQAFAESDKVLSQSVKTITDLILLPGLINLDFADVKATLQGKGLALIGFGSGTGQNKAIDAATSAIASPLLEASIKGAHSAIINVTGGSGVTLDETQEAISYITEAAGANINIIFGIQQNPELNDEMLISVIATEFDEDYVPQDTTPIVSRPLRQPTPQVEQEPQVEPSLTPDTNSILPDFFSDINDEDND
ncbi:MAG: cell division protein FtsZ [Bacillales bacterium]|nr:cell division protein FtsZ [Bacillales bacterium]